MHVGSMLSGGNSSIVCVCYPRTSGGHWSSQKSPERHQVWMRCWAIFLKVPLQYHVEIGHSNYWMGDKGRGSQFWRGLEDAVDELLMVGPQCVVEVLFKVCHHIVAFNCLSLCTHAKIHVVFWNFFSPYSIFTTAGEPIAEEACF